MSPVLDSHATRWLRLLARGVIRGGSWWVYPQVLAAAACLAYTATHLGFLSDRNDLVGSDKKYHHVFQEYRRDFQDQGDLVAVVESNNPEKNREFVERLAARLRSETNVFTDVFYKGSLTEMGQKALLFLPTEDLRELNATLKEYTPFLESFSSTTNLVSLFEHINSEFIDARNKSDEEIDSLLGSLPALKRILIKAGDSLERPGTAISPGLSALFGADREAEDRQYITFADGRFYLVTARALSWDRNAEAVPRMRELVAETRAEIPGVNANITGEPVLEVDEMAQAQEDMIVASIVSFIFVALVFIFGYHQTGRPIKATLCLVIGLAYTMAYTTLAIGHLNILTITFAPILIGLAIDFGVHLISRFEEELSRGAATTDAIEHAMVHTGQGIFTGAFTTAGAFFAMGLTDFDGIQEMGIITGGGMLICLVPMMTMLPALLLRGRQNAIDRGRDSNPPPEAAPSLRSRMEKFWLRRPRLVLAGGFIVSLAAATQLPRVWFDYNLLNLQTKDLPAVNVEKQLIQTASKSVIFGISIADTVEETLNRMRAFEALDSVASVEAVAPYFKAPSDTKLQLIRSIVEQARKIQFARPDPRPVDLPQLNRTLWAFQGYLKAASRQLVKEGDQPALLARIQELYQITINLRRSISHANTPSAILALTRFEESLFSDIHDTFAALANQKFRSRLQPEDLPRSLSNRFVGQSGRHLIQVYPKENVWERVPQEDFVKETRTVDPIITGAPVQLYEYTTLLKESYVDSAWYALGAIVVLVLLHFRSPVAVVLALMPVAVGALWTLGLMGALNLPFNPANIMTLPLVIGIGVTNGIHILNRFSEEHRPDFLSNSTGKAVIVSGLTTIGGFASLNLAKHQGIASLGAIMSIGVAACMIAALTLLPALLALRPLHPQK